MKILVVEDDKDVASAVKASLSSGSHAVDISEDGVDGVFMARSYDYDAIILDQNLPKKDGLTVCRDIRSSGKNAPIIFLSVDGEMETKLSAFRNGADDYMTKPFSFDELKARIDAVGRRAPKVKKAVLKVYDVTLDLNDFMVTRAGRRIRLTRKEFHMLQYFMGNPGIILSRAQLMEHIWTADSNPFSNTIEAHIRNLRMKLNAGGLPNLIANLQGRGYIMDTPDNLEKI
ncbi:MAG: response regulator transcription factor [Patescibacteria group bacterium]|nr:response regulator transcription factor [Patescibacteria group bacterium]